MLLRYLLIPILLCLACVCSAQNDFKFESLTTENGLSENMVNVFYQDTKGYLWIGTHDGLNRYDGYEFKKFRHDPADKNSLPDNTVMDICEDGQNNLWVASNIGFCKLNTAENKFTVLIPDTIYGVSNQILSLNKNEMILKHGDKIYRVENSSGHMERIFSTDKTNKIFSGYSALYKSNEIINLNVNK